MRRSILSILFPARVSRGRDHAAAAGGGRGDDAFDVAFQEGGRQFALGGYEAAVVSFRKACRWRPDCADALNNWGSALCKLGRYAEAQDRFTQAIALDPCLVTAYSNLGTIQRWMGAVDASAETLRRALALRPDHVVSATSLASTLVLQGRLEEASGFLQRVLNLVPRDHEALIVRAQIFALHGRFDDAARILLDILDVDPGKINALTLLMGLRRMLPRDRKLVQRAVRAARQPIAPLEEANLRFAIGKYHDDVGLFGRAFVNYQRANRLLKCVAPEYDRRQRSRWVDDIIATHSPTAVAAATAGGSGSSRPVFIVGMIRSGTSLAEQILSSHPDVVGAGELPSWNDALHRHAEDVRRGPLPLAVRQALGTAYLAQLEQYSADARHVIDKAPLNSDRLGVIHSVFPQARIIYMRRDPLDTCLSCYFQQFSPSLNFTMDLGDLAHYHREHQRLIAHWRTVLPPGTLLEVPYAGLIADQDLWTRRILDFVGLEWHEACARFDENKRPVITASSWQVRQKIYTRSIDRWRNYAKFIGPLLELQNA